ncbi:caspase, EACC1-associated type [Streptomyces sp. enrichment culture]|uniref:caspase, EACC1-associated type n=1 Tax=Streptomyces sp. enrichment culture TaxID=1795815 RepID=UPI003F54EF18
MLAEPLNSRAILMGTYAYTSLDDLPAVRNNVERLGELLTDDKVWGLPSEHCTQMLQWDNAAKMVDTVKRIAAAVTDTLIVYYAGHGLTVSRSMDLCLSLPESRVNEIHTTLPYDWLRQAVLSSQALRKVVILDCCYSGRAMPGMSAPSEIAQDAEIEGTYLLAAAAETKKALAPPGENYTAFTAELVHVMENGIPDAGELLDMDTIYRHVHTALAGKSRPLPQQRNRNTAARITFIRNRAVPMDSDAAPDSTTPTERKSLAESGLAHALRLKAQMTGDYTLIDDAISLYQRALAASRLDSADYAKRLAELGDTLRFRAEVTGDRASLDDAIELLRSAVAAAPEGHLDRVFCLTSLGNALRLRAQETSDSASLMEAADILRAAVESAETGRPDSALPLQSLGGTLWGISQIDEGAGIEEAIGAWRTAATTVGAPTRLRIDAARQWGEAAADHEGAAAGREALSLAVSLMPHLAAWQIDLLDQERQLSDFLGLASDAAACHLAAGDPHAALQVLEQGRGVLLNRIMDISSESAVLRESAPELADEFERLRTILGAEEGAAGDGGDGFRETPVVFSGQALDRRHSAARRLDELITRIRHMPGFEGFLLPPTMEELARATEAGPVVTVNVSRYRSDALILSSDGLSVLPLPALDIETVRRRTSEFLGAVTPTGHAFEDRISGQRTIRDTLAWLWDCLVEPVTEALGCTTGPVDGQAWPRIFWCPTGLLSLLPLHAAGHHDPTSGPTPRNLMDLAVSSYTTTLRNLLRSRSGAGEAAAAGEQRFLVVSLADGDGVVPLPGAERETRRLLERFPHATHLSEHGATRSTVKRGLSTSEWAHFACHSLTELDHPINSGLLLADGRLAVREITRLRYQVTPKLVYLSGCGTAQGGTRLADEAIHVSSAFQASGFAHVIGTLWPIDDRVAASMADAFYAQVQAGLVDPAFAIQQAARRLRDRYPAAPILWAPMIHLGMSRGSPDESSPMAVSPAGEATYPLLPQEGRRGTVLGAVLHEGE